MPLEWRAGGKGDHVNRSVQNESEIKPELEVMKSRSGAHVRPYLHKAENEHAAKHI